jgi:hypothetical protein
LARSVIGSTAPSGKFGAEPTSMMVFGLLRKMSTGAELDGMRGLTSRAPSAGRRLCEKPCAPERHAA